MALTSLRETFSKLPVPREVGLFFSFELPQSPSRRGYHTQQASIVQSPAVTKQANA